MKEKMILSKGVYSKKKPKILKQIEIEYPENSYANDEILDAVKLSHLITSTLKKHKMKTNSVIFAIQHGDINIVDLQVPYVKKYMQQAVNAKVSERYIGVLERNLLSYKIAKIEGNLCTGSVAIAPRMLIHAYYDLSMKLGMKLISIDYMGNILYKNMFYESKEIETKTFLIADMTSNEIVVHLYSDGLLRLSRSESGNIMLADDEALTTDFVFDNKLTITNDDIIEINKLFSKIKMDLVDLSAFHSTQNILFKRYSTNEEHTDEEIMTVETALAAIEHSLLDLNSFMDKDPDFTTVNELHIRDYFKSLLEYLTKIGVYFRKTKVMSSSFAEEIEKLLSNMVSNSEDAINVVGKYIASEVDQKKMDRRKLLHRICKLAVNVMLVADMSGQYPDITDIYVQGIALDASEKRLISQNLSKHSDVECAYYENWIQDANGIALGTFCNQYRHFHDFNLSQYLEKNDKINRNNYDNLIFGVAGAVVVSCIALLLLSGYNWFSINGMQRTIADNQEYIKKNDDVFKLVNKENTLKDDIGEIENIQSYFDLAKVDVEEIYYELSDFSKNLTFEEIGIDGNFLVTLSVKAPQLTDVSVFTEMLINKGYLGVRYSNITTSKDGGFVVQVNYQYAPPKKNK